MNFLIEMKNEIERLVNGTSNTQVHNDRFFELLRIDLLNDVFDIVFKIIQKFYFRLIIENSEFNDSLENILINYWKIRNDFDEEFMLDMNLYASGNSPILTHGFSRMNSSTTNISEHILMKRFGDGIHYLSQNKQLNQYNKCDNISVKSDKSEKSNRTDKKDFGVYFKSI